MSYLRGPARFEVQLLPPCLNDYVPSNASVRFIEAFVETLDLQQLGFTHAKPAKTGRPPYHPADLIKLYIYGYLNGIRSSRKLEAETRRNLEVIWLLRGLSPDFKTIADFRAANSPAFKPLFRQFNLICRKLDLFGAELVAIDGSKFKAVNSPRNHYSQKLLKEILEKLEQRIDRYLKALDEADQEAVTAPSSTTAHELEGKIARLKEEREQFKKTLADMQENKTTEVSEVDPDSRGMQKVGVGYNVQVAVDAKHHLIVEPQVVQSACDRGQLSNMALAAKEQLGAPSLNVVADAGYHEADQLEKCEQNQIQTFVPDTGKTSGLGKGGAKVFPKEQFAYDPTTDTYRCPGNAILKRGFQTKSRGKDRAVYYNGAACRKCALKGQCTAQRFRWIARRLNEDVTERQAQRMKAHPEMMARRREIVEHVFGTFRNRGYDKFLMKGLQKVRAEISLSSLAYNLRRVLNLVSLGNLMKTV